MLIISEREPWKLHDDGSPLTSPAGFVKHYTFTVFAGACVTRKGLQHGGWIGRGWQLLHPKRNGEEMKTFWNHNVILHYDL